MSRDTLFISHATPEDNEFSIWIASRLEMLGYSIWIDKEGLLGGERFWPTIQNVIRDKTIKVLLVYSKSICDCDGNLKDGIDKEISYAESIAKQENIEDYIIPLHIDKDLKYNSFIGANRLNHIPFEENWALGLKQLLKKLEKDSIPKFSLKYSSLVEWYENEYISRCSIVSKNELYYTSWWQIKELPLKFHMLLFSNATQARTIRDLNSNIPIGLLSNVLSSFDENLNFHVERDNEEFEVVPEKIYSFKIVEILEGFESENYPQHRDVENNFKHLLRCIFSNIIRKRGLWKAELSNKRIAYYLPKYQKIQPVRFFYLFSNQKKEKKKSILGKFEDIGYWHYAISIQPMLYPIVGFKLKSHLIFSNDGFNAITDEKKAQSYRRRKGRRFFNEEWRDLELAFIQNLKDSENDIKIVITNDQEYLKMKLYPEFFWSQVGYTDPQSYMDLSKIENYSEEKIEDEND